MTMGTAIAAPMSQTWFPSASDVWSNPQLRGLPAAVIFSTRSGESMAKRWLVEVDNRWLIGFDRLIEVDNRWLID